MLKINSAQKLEKYIRRYPELRLEVVENFIYKVPHLNKTIDLSKMQHAIAVSTNKNVLVSSILPENCSVRKLNDEKYIFYTKCMQNGEIIFFLDSKLELAKDLKVIVNKNRKKISYAFKDKSLVEENNEMQKIVKNLMNKNKFYLVTEKNNLKNYEKSIAIKYESDDYYIDLYKDKDISKASIRKTRDFDFVFEVQVSFNTNSNSFIEIKFKKDDQSISYNKETGFTYASTNTSYYDENPSILNIKNIEMMDSELEMFMLLKDINYKKIWNEFEQVYNDITRNLKNLNNNGQNIINIVNNLKKIENNNLNIKSTNKIR